MRNIFTILLRFLGLWVFNAICLLACEWVIPGITIIPYQGVPYAVTVMEVSLIFSIMNLFVRPLILLFTLPLNGLTFGLFSLVVNALVLFLASEFTPFFKIEYPIAAFLSGFLFALVNIIITSLIPIDEDFLYYDILVNRFRKSGEKINKDKKGIIVIEIDGLAYPRLIKAIEKRKMPYLKELIDSGKFTISEFDCGIPSQTSSCQAGIMYGDNQNICAYRWYDKEQKRIISSSSFQDTNQMEQEILRRKKNGLLDGGMSINNLMSGNADVSLFTVSAIQPKNSEELNNRNINLYFFSLRPYLLTKSILFALADAAVEVIQYVWACLKRKEPRLNRLVHFYPLIRGSTNVLLRDASTALTINEAMRGGPASYTTFYGYDEIAHHSGPDSFEAYHALSGIDHSIKKIHHTAEENSDRDYELFVISDHGQSFGKTFRQRYGYSISDYIRKLAGECARLKSESQVIGIGNSAADNESSIRAAIYDLTAQKKTQQIPIPKQTLNKLDTVLEENADETRAKKRPEDNDIWILASGNLANVYFSFSNQKVDYAEIESHYPNLCYRLIQHPGVGLMVVHQNKTAIAIGKKGSRNLSTGEISGQDPLANYQPTEMRSRQLSYLAEFPNGGDLILFSTFYPDGTVAAFEELIGSHGGIGGEQNTAFMFHPINVEVPENIFNSKEVYAILKGRRELDAEIDKFSEEKTKQNNGSEDWKWDKLIAGIRDTSKWTKYMREVILFQSSIYKKISKDTSLNGPAVLIMMISLLSNMTVAGILFRSLKGLYLGLIIWLVSWIIVIGASYGATLALRQNIIFSDFLRGMIFCTVFDVLLFGALIPGYENFWIVIILVTRLISVSLAINGICNIQGKRSLLIVPVVLFMLILLMITTYVILESLGYILKIDPLIDFINHINEIVGIS